MNKYKDNMILSKAWPIFKSYAVYFTAAYIMLLGSIISIWITMGGALLFLGQLLYDFIFVVRNVRKNFLLLWLDTKAKRWVLYRIKGETSNIDSWKSNEVLYDVEFVKSSLRYTEVAENIKTVRLLEAGDVKVVKFPFPFRIPFPTSFVSREVLYINEKDANLVMSSMADIGEGVKIASNPMNPHDLVDIGVSGY